MGFNSGFKGLTVGDFWAFLNPSEKPPEKKA